MTHIRRTSERSPARLKHEDHLALWRAVEGALLDMAKQHPDYLTERGLKLFLPSATKRVVGAVRSLEKG
ncbi:hypothetical protein [Sagittula sp. MA-2]|uniref:hypothetical protein n=1 Tax=Sagittula sp. MA-2 TaxID=3048007 RepID=UPI0024C39E16|nr:hypothetical protein [Sagittula sp. MA-2]WHZ36523.1 hypothetical protein QNI11_05795 [Sagittula sp. MA-2]